MFFNFAFVAFILLLVRCRKRGPPLITSALRGVCTKNEVREVAWIQYCRPDSIADKGGGGSKKRENLAEVLNRSLQISLRNRPYEEMAFTQLIVKAFIFNFFAAMLL